MDDLAKSITEIKEKVAKMNTDMSWIKESLKRIEEKLENKADRDELDEIKKTLADHEQRLRITEKHDYKEIGAIMLGSALLSGGIILLVLKLALHV